MKKIILKETFNLVGKDILALDRGRWRYWFLVGNRFDSGQDRLWNVADAPFDILPSYIHFRNGNTTSIMNNLIVYEVLI